MKKNYVSEEGFLKQSYYDAWNDYAYSLEKNNSAHWDWIIITASNQRQADAYSLQIEKRRQRNNLPENTHFAIIPDLNDERIGSGGATLNVLRFIYEQEGFEELLSQKILILHSGGDSKRIPQYSALGKLFAPVPRCLPSGERSTIFDELLIAFSGIPARIESGMLIAPGDTELLFNPLQLELLSCDAAGLSIKTRISEGMGHGVFVKGKNNLVRHFFHKQPEHILREMNAQDEKDNINIDTGCIWFSKKLVYALSQLFCDNGKYIPERFHKFVNAKVCLSFYADFVAPLASDVTMEDYFKEIPENVFSKELLECRKIIWDKLHCFDLSLIQLSPARYIHFGSTQEMFHLAVHATNEYSYIGWNKKVLCNETNLEGYSANNCLIKESDHFSSECYLEDSIIDEGVDIGNQVIISGLYVKNMKIPNDIVLHCLLLNNNKYVCRIYGILDNPKGSADSSFLGTTLRMFLKKNNIAYADIWKKSPTSIWNAELYVECSSMKEALEQAMLLLRIVKGNADESDIAEWKLAKRYSLQNSFAMADITATLEWQAKIEHLVHVETCIDKIKRNINLEYAADHILQKDTTELELLYERAKAEKNVSIKMRLFLLLSIICKKGNIQIRKQNDEIFEDMAYESIKDVILHAVQSKYNIDQSLRILGEKKEVELPVRVNFCGSPSDAAPYCLEHGGTMMDGTLLLDGKLPIKAVVKRIDAYEIQFESIDLNASIAYQDISPLRECGNPYDVFALHKAVLITMGIIPNTAEGTTLNDICKKLGGGLFLSTSVQVPKGSGLGTSSILAAACVRAVSQLLGQNDLSNDVIYALVFAIEQRMNTGGGWQDQVGGLTNGLKYMQSLPGYDQNIKVDYLHLEKNTFQELQDRFVLVFSGQRRLARNVLREEMNQCIKNNEASLESIDSIRKICALMKFELERGNITAFAKYLTEQFNLVKQLDKGASNTCIEYIFDICNDLIDGKSICGAGGGGFLQMILKKGVTKIQLKERIKETFQDCGIEVWDSTFI